MKHVIYIYRFLVFVSITMFICLVPMSVSALPSDITLSDTTFIKACEPGGVAVNTPVCSDVKNEVSQNNNPVVGIIKDVIDIISFIVGVASIIIILVSALRLIISNGDSKVMAEARMGLVGAVIGLVVVVFAQLIVIFVLDKVG